MGNPPDSSSHRFCQGKNVHLPQCRLRTLSRTFIKTILLNLFFFLNMFYLRSSRVRFALKSRTHGFKALF